MSPFPPFSAQNFNFSSIFRQNIDPCSQVSYRRVHDAVSGGGAMAATAALCEQYVDTSLALLRQFGDSDATRAIEKIATSII